MSPRHLLPVAVLVLLPAHVDGAETLWTDVVVRVYDSTGTSPAERRRALDVAASIVSSASIELIWKSCEDSAHAPASCAVPLAPGELAVRIVHSRTGVAGRSDVPLGNALVDAAAGSAVLATIYLDRVNWMAQRTGVDRQKLLGRAIAHELGHLLMATNAHAVYGLMRPVWSLSEIRRGRNSDWTFEAQEIAAIKTRAGLLPHKGATE